MSALDRARAWFVAPPEPHGDGPAWSAPPPAERDEGVLPTSRPAGAEHHTHFAKSPRGGWQPPLADGSPVDEEVAAPRAAAPTRPAATTAAAPRTATPTRPAATAGAAPRAATPTRPAATTAGAPRTATSAAAPARPAATAGALPRVLPAATADTSPRVVTSAAVLGRAGEVEPVAAALALALRRESRAAAATVAVIGAALPDVAGGGGAARRLGARLEGHGFEVHVRGRVAWVRLDPADAQLALAGRRVALVGAPAVLAVTAPRNAATDAALVECDLLVIVAAEPEGPLAKLAASGIAGVPVVTVRPLGRGPARALARAGIRSTRPVRDLLSTEQEQE